MPPADDLVKLVFASGPAHLNRALIERTASLDPGIPLWVVSEFEPAQGQWIPYHVFRGVESNIESIKASLGGRRIHYATMLYSSTVPVTKMRAVARAIAPDIVACDESLRPTTYTAHLIRQVAAAAASPRTKKWLRILTRPWDAEIPVRARLAQLHGTRARQSPIQPAPPAGSRPLRSPGVTVVIPSRDGRDLLETLFASLLPQLQPGEVIVSDNGSTDATLTWLAANHPEIHIAHSPAPLSFARAVNAGIHMARCDKVLLLNNDMVLEPGFIAALEQAFTKIPALFCATAQIFFPPGIRRQETGKAVWRSDSPLDFPVRCDDPVPGEDLTWVLYGSGGCSLFDTEKLLALGGVSEIYDPAYVEDMDFGYRAWKLGWPSVFCAGARVEHRHRATTSRFYTQRQLDAFIEINYLRFLTAAIGDAALFRRLWYEAVRRLQLLGSLDALRGVPDLGPQPQPTAGHLSEPEILALGNGDVAVFPGTVPAGKRVIVVATPYLPWPLSHGGAVRIFNMIQGTAPVLIAFCDELATPAPELLAVCREVIIVRRHGSHYRRDTARPDTVEEFDSLTFRAVLKQSVVQWKPEIVQLEFTQMAQYADACHPARTILVEHDITFDLQQQLLATDPHNWELARQLEKWQAFETAAWTHVNAVVTMSARDEASVHGAREVCCLPNGVDTVRFQPTPRDPEPRRLLFIGSFRHLPNVMAVSFFVNEVWPLLGRGFHLHIIAGMNPERYPVQADLSQPGIEIEAYVADVRDAYSRAEIVLAPLPASAGTNIKVLEAMAAGRLVISTPAGINGLDVVPGQDILVAAAADQFAALILTTAKDRAVRQTIEQNARQTALRYAWGNIAALQSELYTRLTAAR